MTSSRGKIYIDPDTQYGVRVGAAKHRPTLCLSYIRQLAQGVFGLPKLRFLHTCFC